MAARQEIRAQFPPTAFNQLVPPVSFSATPNSGNSVSCPGIQLVSAQPQLRAARSESRGRSPQRRESVHRGSAGCAARRARTSRIRSTCGVSSLCISRLAGRNPIACKRSLIQRSAADGRTRLSRNALPPAGREERASAAWPSLGIASANEAQARPGRALPRSSSLFMRMLRFASPASSPRTGSSQAALARSQRATATHPRRSQGRNTPSDGCTPTSHRLEVPPWRLEGRRAVYDGVASAPARPARRQPWSKGSGA